MERDRRLRRDERPTLRVALVWLALCAIMLAVGWPRVVQGQFPDPDDVLRLVQVRDLLAGQGWFDVTQYRIDPPRGAPMHWSRLVDIPLALMIGMLAPLLGQATAETMALVAVPLLTFGATLWVVGRLAWRLLGPQTAVYACLACGFLPALLFQFQPMRIDHHGWQVFAVALALWAISARNPRTGAALAGLAMAAGLSISIELLPMAAAFGAILALRWLRDVHERWWLVVYLQALAIGLTGLFLLTRGLADLAQHCDAIAPAHLGFFVVVALATSAIAPLRTITPLALTGLLAAAGIAGLAAFALASPQCVATPFAALDPLVHDFWYVNVLEGQPLWRQRFAFAAPIAIQLAVGLAGTLYLRWRARDWLRRWWGDYLLLLLAATLLSVFVWRSAAFASVIAAIPLGFLLQRLLARLRGSRRPLSKGLAVAAIVLLLVPSIPVVVAQKIGQSQSGKQVALVAESACRIGDQAAKLDQLPPSVVFAPLDIGPAILVKSHHSVVATGHHRAAAAMRDVIAAYTAEPDEAETIIARHEAQYLVICTDLMEPRLFAHAAPDGLMAHLLAGDVPAWLEPVPIEGPPEFAVYRVVRPYAGRKSIAAPFMQ